MTKESRLLYVFIILVASLLTAFFYRAGIKAGELKILRTIHKLYPEAEPEKGG